MPNTFAYIALFSWPVVVFALFRMMPRAQALIASILGGYLLLPYGVGIDLPMLPTFDKTLIPALSAAVMCLLIPGAQGRRRRRRGNTASVSSTAFTQGHDVTARRPMEMRKRREVAVDGKLQVAHGPVGRRIEMALILLLVFTPFLTVLHNAEPYSAGPNFLPGLRIYDAFSMILSALVAFLPYWLARRYLAGPDQHVLLLRGLCIAGLLYSLPSLFEVRMSPQLSRWVYGFLAQSFVQAMRDGGFRPVVFLQHGLWLAIFLAMTALAAFALWRHERKGGRWLLAGVWLLGTLMLCHSLGAFAIAFLLLPIVLLMSVRIQMLVAVGFAITILFYPMLRGAGLIPVDDITAVAETISPERAQSFEFRLKNEDILLAHANAKPLAGWGGWGRSRVYRQLDR